MEKRLTAAAEGESSEADEAVLPPLSTYSEASTVEVPQQDCGSRGTSWRIGDWHCDQNNLKFDCGHHSCHQSFKSGDELKHHICIAHKQKCVLCGIKNFRSRTEHDKHHIEHAKNRKCSVELRGLGPEYRREAEIVHNNHCQEPSKVLRITLGRQARIAEERQKQERSRVTENPKSRNKEAMEVPNKTAGSEHSASSSPAKSLQPEPSPAGSINLRCGNSPSSVSALSPQSQALVERPLISVRNPASLLSDEALRNINDKLVNTVQLNPEAPEFVSLESLGSNITKSSKQDITLASILTPPHCNTPVTSHCQTPPVQHSQLLQAQLQQQQPAVLQSQLVVNQQVMMTSHLVSSTNNQHLQNMQNMQPRPSPITNPVFQCEVCNFQTYTFQDLETHKKVSNHFSCPICCQNFQNVRDLDTHYLARHRQDQQPNVPPPSYQQHIHNLGHFSGAIVNHNATYQQQQQQMFAQQRYVGGSAQQGPIGHPMMQPNLQNMQMMMQPRGMQQMLQPGMPHYQVPIQPRGGTIRNPIRHRFQQPITNNAAHRQPMQGNTLRQATPAAQKRPAETQPGAPSVKKRLGIDIPTEQPDDCQIIAVQRGGDGVPQITNVQGASPLSSPRSAASTLLNNSNISVSIQPIDKTKPQPEVVADILKDRGITVTAKAKATPTKSEEAKPAIDKKSALANIPEALINNTSIHISQTMKPRNGQKTDMPAPPAPAPAPAQAVERPARSPTVDLTQETRTINPAIHPQNKVFCPICQKGFNATASLNKHIGNAHKDREAREVTRCTMCNANYTTVEALNTHIRVVHNNINEQASELVIPLVNVQDVAVVNKLASLGIKFYIPLSSTEGGGTFSIPVISAETSVKNPNIAIDLGAVSFMKFGQMHTINNRRM